MGIAICNQPDFLLGRKLYGDDFAAQELADWYADEREGYAQLEAGESVQYQYAFHALNRYHGYRHLRRPVFRHALALGGAYGDELVPILPRVRQLTILEPSMAFARDSLHGVLCTYVRPDPSGRMPFRDSTFDLVTCLGVLHHIANVTAVMRELYRCTEPGGCLLVREPVISLGDWSSPRPGLTKRERGIPLRIFRETIASIGFMVDRASFCFFSPLMRLCKWVGLAPYNSRLLTWVDAALSALFGWNLRYHRTRWHHKMAPGSVFFVLAKPGQ